MKEDRDRSGATLTGQAAAVKYKYGERTWGRPEAKSGRDGGNGKARRMLVFIIGHLETKILLLSASRMEREEIIAGKDKKCDVEFLWPAQRCLSPTY